LISTPLEQLENAGYFERGWIDGLPNSNEIVGRFGLELLTEIV
jgi:hypothetical protein